MDNMEEKEEEDRYMILIFVKEIDLSNKVLKPTKDI
jgi:hypothetical protein